MAIIGLGGMGKKYALLLESGQIEEIKLAAVVARSQENQKWARENLGLSVKIFESSEKMYQSNADFDCVLIATDHRAHPQLAMEAFCHRKHVMCDKPAGIRLSDAMEMEAAAEKSGKKYGMMFHNRTYPVLLKIKEILDSQKLGKLCRILLENTIYYRTAYYHHSAEWRSCFWGEGGGCLMNQGQHILDYWQWLFGMPQSLYAQLSFGKYNDFMVEDEAVLMMTYPENLTAAFILTTGEIPKKERLEIIGTKGSLTMDENTIHLELYEKDSYEYGQKAQVVSREEMRTRKQTIQCMAPKLPYVEMIRNFARAVLYNEPLIAEGVDGTRAMELTNAAYLSGWKKKWVYFPVDSKEYDALLSRLEAQEVCHSSVVRPK